MTILPLSASDEPTDSAEKVRGRQVWLVFPGLPESLPNPVSYRAGQQLGSVPLSRRRPAGPIAIGSAKQLELVKANPLAGEAGAPEQLAFARVDIPLGMRQALVIFTPLRTSKNGLEYRAELVNLKKLGAGGQVYFNFCPMPVSVVIEKSKLLIQPGQRESFRPARLAQSTRRPG